MKIALYVPSWPPGFDASGIVTYASELIPALRRLGHEVYVLAGRKATDDDDPYTIDVRHFSRALSLWNRVVFRFAPGAIKFTAWSSALVSAIRHLQEEHKLDVLEIEESYGWSFAIARMIPLPIVVRLHGPWFLIGRFGNPKLQDVGNSGRIEREGRAIQHAHFVTAPTAMVLRAVKDHYSLGLAASRVIPNPLGAAAETDIWDVKSCNLERLLFVGRFDALKGGDLVLRVFAELAVSYPRLRLTFVGPDHGIEADGDKLQLFEDFIDSNFPAGLRSRIDFHGQVSQADVMRLRTKHLATIVASQNEMMPYSVLEAMSLGCPVIATAVGGIPEMIKHQRSGLLVPSQNVGAMAAACKTLLDDPTLAARLGRQAWQDCHDLFGPEVIAKQTVAAYREAIKAFNDRDVV